VICPDGTFDANDLVYDNIGTLFRWAEDRSGEARSALENLADFAIQPVNFAVSYNLNQQLLAFSKPEKPDRPELEIQLPEDPGAAPWSQDDQPVADRIKLTEAPKDSLPPSPDLSFGQEPGSFTGIAPTKPGLTTVTLPPEPTLETAIKPTLLELDLPVYDPITLPEFEGIRPVRTFGDVQNTFVFDEPPYQLAVLNETKAAILRILNGDEGFSAPVEQAIFDRAMVREERDGQRAVEEAYHDGANRGFDRPTGATMARVAEVRQGVLERRATVSREVMLRADDTQRENLRLAIAQGIALEQTLIGLHNSIYDRLLQAQQVAVRIALEVYNAQIAAFNADQQAYATDAAVFRDRIAAAQQRVDIFRALVEVEKAKAEINRELVNAYEAEIRAELAKVEQYKALVEAKRVENDINTQRIEAFRAEVQAFVGLVDAWSKEWDGYRTRTQAQAEKLRAYEIGVNAYTARLNAWSETQRTEIAKGQFYLSEKDLDIRGYLALLQKFDSALRAETARVASTSEAFQADARMFEAEGRIEDSRQAANQRGFQLKMEEERTRKELSLRNAEVQIQQGIQVAQILLQKLTSLSDVYGRLAVSATSAINLGASISSSNSKGCSTSYNFSGEVAT
jgi:hypothetical protein